MKIIHDNQKDNNADHDDNAHKIHGDDSHNNTN